MARFRAGVSEGIFASDVISVETGESKLVQRITNY